MSLLSDMDMGYVSRCLSRPAGLTWRAWGVPRHRSALSDCTWEAVVEPSTWQWHLKDSDTKRQNLTEKLEIDKTDARAEELTEALGLYLVGLYIFPVLYWDVV